MTLNLDRVNSDLKEIREKGFIPSMIILNEQDFLVLEVNGINTSQAEETKELFGLSLVIIPELLRNNAFLPLHSALILDKRGQDFLKGAI